MSEAVTVSVDSGGAIYVNDTRITDRSTKWGVKTVLCGFKCRKHEVVSRVRDMGFDGHIKHIDTEPYVSQREALENQP